jgi:transcriptional regulator with XRE-family HTH domain
MKLLSVQGRLELKRLFQKRGVTQAQLAVLTGAYRQNVGAWLNGSGSISGLAQQQLVAYAESLRTQEASDGHQPVD